jgi:hypothetical protein
MRDGVPEFQIVTCGTAVGSAGDALVQRVRSPRCTCAAGEKRNPGGIAPGFLYSSSSTFLCFAASAMIFWATLAGTTS